MPVSYQSPGVYVEEVDRGTKPIEGVGTAVAAFVGFTEKAEEPSRNGGPPTSLLNKASLVTNWNQFAQKYGGFVEGAFLPQAVYGYFANGGGRAYIVSVNTLGASVDPSVAKPAQAALPTSADANVKSLEIKARQGGPAGNEIEVEVKHETGDTFTLIASRGSDVERFEGLTMGSGDTNVETVVNAQSTLVEVAIARKTGKLAERRPAPGKYPLAGGEMKALTVTATEFEGDTAKREGIGGLEALDDVTMVCAPDLMTSYMSGDIDLDGVKAVQGALLDHCERMKYRFAILDAPPKLSPQEIGEWRKAKAGYDSKFGALYYP
ncbi:MAG: phage tail sheath family protein, partial [Acidobacteriota bacterium]